MLLRYRNFLTMVVLAIFLLSGSTVYGQQDRHQRNIERKAKRDAKFEELSKDVLDYTKTKYRSSIGDLDIPVYIFQPLEKRGPLGHPALIWVHGGVHGDMDPENYWPFVREAVEKGYVVLAPDYRGSTGYGKEFYDEIDYGGQEVDDVVTAVEYIRSRMSHVDTNRIGMIGFSHGGFITLHAMTRNPGMFRAGAPMVPVTNLVFRLAYKGPRYAALYVEQKKLGGLPHERRQLYIERSPFYQVEKLQDPIVAHFAENDRDVDWVEAQMLAWKLMALKPDLADVKIYKNPPSAPGKSHGGHSFNRRVDIENGYTRLDSPEQRDSWNRIWALFDEKLTPWVGK